MSIEQNTESPLGELQPESHLRVQQTFDRSASVYKEHAGLLAILEERLLERLATLAISPLCILDLGCGQGSRLDRLKKSYPQASVVGIDASAEMLRGYKKASKQRKSRARAFLRRSVAALSRASEAALEQPVLLQANAMALPLTNDSVDLAIAHQLLPWCDSPKTLFAEMYRVLKPGGTVFWSSAGPDTLSEYRKLWQRIDTYPHDFGLLDMHDLGDDMLTAGFDAPVMDRENLTITYSSLDALVRELRGVGCSNLARGRRRGLMASNTPRRLQEALEEKSDMLSMTLELIQGHGWKRMDVQESEHGLAAMAGSHGESVVGTYSVSSDALRKSLQQGRGDEDDK